MRRLFHSFLPFLLLFFVVSAFLVWADFSIEEKSKRSIVIEIHSGQEDLQSDEEEGFRVLRPIFLQEYPKGGEGEEKELYYALSRVGKQGDQNPRELSDLLALAIHYNEYKASIPLVKLLEKDARLQSLSGVDRDKARYNLALHYLSQDQFNKAYETLPKSIEGEQAYLIHLARAVSLIEAKRSDYLEEARQAIAKAEGDVLPYLYFKLGRSLSNRERLQEANDYFDKALAENPDFHQAKLNQAILLRQLKRYEQAEKLYAELLTDLPSYFLAAYNYAVFLEKTDRIPEALQAYQNALTLNPDHLALRESYADLLYEKKRFGEALEHYDWLVRKTPGNHAYLLLKAKCVHQLGNPKEAIQMMTYAIEKQGGNLPDAWMELGDIYLDDDQNEKALKAYENALRLNEQSSDALGRIAKYHSRQNDFAKALSYYEKALAQDPKDGLLLRRIGILYEDQGEYRKAIRYLKDSIPYLNNPYRSYRYLFNAYFRLRQYGKADEAIRLALKIRSEDADDWYSYGRNLYLLDRVEESMKAYQKALELADQADTQLHSRIYRRMGRGYRKLEQLDKAQQSLQEAIALDNDYFNARLDFARLWLEDLKDQKRGVEELELALRLRPKSCIALRIAEDHQLKSYHQAYLKNCLRN